MKRIYKTVTSILLCVIMLFSCVSPCFAAQLPSGVTASQVTSAIPKIESLAKTLLSQNEKTANLSSTVYGLLFDDATVNAIFSGVYSALAENESTFNTLGIDISLTAVADKLTAYPEVSSYLRKQESWSQALSKELTCKWNIKNKDGFSKAMAAIFSPFEGLLYTLLCGGTYKVNLLVYVEGSEGYTSAIVPILKAIGCPSIMSQSDFSAKAKSDNSTQIKNIVNMLYASIDAILAAPVDKLCTVLPSLAYFVKNDGIKTSLETLIAPMKVKIGLISLSGLDEILEKSGMLSDEKSLTDMFEDMDLSALTGETLDVDLKLPDFDLDALAACCTYANGNYTVDKASSLCEILRWALKLVRQNKSKLTSLIGGDKTTAKDASDFISTLLKKSDDELIKLIFDIINLDPDDMLLEYSWTYPEYTPGSITYTENLTETEYTTVLNEIDATLNEFMTEFGDGSLSSTLSSAIYSSKTLTTIVKALYGALYTEDTSALLNMLGLDASTQGIASVIASSYPSAAKALKKYSSWDKLGENSLSWGFSTGSREGFEKALITALRPLIPFLDLLLCEGEIELLDAISFKGSNGYNTAVIPLLEGLGCTDVKTYSEYKGASGTDNALKYILDPVFNLIDQLIEKPVATICNKLPNIVWFVNSGGIKQCIDNLIYPVTKLLEKFGMSDMMPDSFNDFGNIDVGELLTSLKDSGTLAITLPEPDLALLSSLGTAVEYQSQRTYNGICVNYTYIEANAPAVLVTVLRYFIDALSMDENSDVLSSLMSGDAMEGNEMFAMYAGNITEKFADMTTDEIIEWLYDLLFRETPKQEIVEDDGFIPTVTYVPKEDHSTRNKAILIAAAILIPTLLVIFLAKTDFSAIKERRQRKKLKKKAKKEAKHSKKQALPVLNSQSVQRAKTPQEVINRSYEKTPDPDNKKAVELQNRRINEIQNKKALEEKTRTENPEYSRNESQRNEKSRNLRAKEDAKLKIRQDKAVKKALKEAKKADKYYEQALHEAKKHR